MKVSIPEMVALEVDRLESEKGIPAETTLKALGEYLERRMKEDGLSVSSIVASWLSGGEPVMKPAPTKAAPKVKTMGVGQHAPRPQIHEDSKTSAPLNEGMEAPKERFTKQKKFVPETIE